MVVFTGELTERNLHVEFGSPSPTVGNDRWAWRRWRTRSSSRRCSGCSKVSMSKTFSVSAMASGLDEVVTTHLMRCRSASLANE